MKAEVAIYETHEGAMKAVQALSNAKFPLKQVSLIGKAEIIEDNMHLKSMEAVKNTPLVIGSIAGPVCGLLTGIGIFAIPGFGFLYGAGAVIGAIGGFDLGLISGGFITLLATMGIKDDSVIDYEEHVSEGNFLVIIQGSLEDIQKAEHILHTEGHHLEWHND